MAYPIGNTSGGIVVVLGDSANSVIETAKAFDAVEEERGEDLYLVQLPGDTRVSRVNEIELRSALARIH